MNMWEYMLLTTIDPKNRLWIGVSLGILLVVILAAFIVLHILRKRLHCSHRNARFESTFTLDQLRQLHQQGQISDQEYKTLRDRTLTDNGVSEE